MADAWDTEGGTPHPTGEPGEAEGADMRALPSSAASSAGNEALASADHALEVERQRYRDLSDLISDGYLVTDPDGIIQEANLAAAQLLQAGAGELVGQPLTAYVHSSDRTLLRELMAAAGRARPSASAVLRLQPQDSPPLEAALKVAASQPKDQPGRLLWLVRDVSERQRAQAERERLLVEVERQRDTVEVLAEALERDWSILQTIMANTDACLAYLDPDLRLQRFNVAYAEQWGTDEAELLNSSHFLMCPGRQNRAVFEHVRETGEAMALRARPCVRPGMVEAATTHWDWTLVPVKDGSGNVQGMVLSLLDVTEEAGAAEEQARARAALARQNEELMALTRELDAFAHTVAHDLKQPLTIVMGFADMLNEEMGGGLDEQERKMLLGIKQGAYRMRNIVEGLLLLASTRSSGIKPVALNMGDIVREVRHSLASVIEEAGAEVVAPVAWPAAVGYAPWVESVWTNYLTNAIKYGGRPPRVELGAEERPGDWPRFWVRDNGRGLTPEEQSRLFVSFTRLGQPRSLGHGLGLTIVHRIVERLGGEVGVESEPGKGSTFWFTLPPPG
jgi:PAS domain S-box-containing protein